MGHVPSGTMELGTAPQEDIPSILGGKLSSTNSLREELNRGNQCSQRAWGPAGPRGGTAKSPGRDGAGRLSVVRPGRPKCRAAVFGQDGGPYRVRHFSSGQGVDGRGLQDGRGLVGTAGGWWGQRGTIEDGRGRWGTTGDDRGPPGTARVMSHDVKRISLEVHDFGLASAGGPSAGTIVPCSPSGPHLPGRSPS